MLPRVVGTLALVALALACGPSFQAIYEGDARFEHCYAMDDDPTIAMETKAACWADWTKSYRYGQTRDRVEYASLRYRALSRVPAVPTDDALMGAAPGAGVPTTGVSAPSPTNAFAPPPKTLDEADSGTPTTPAAPSPTLPGSAPAAPADKGVRKDLVLPKSTCANACANAWQACKGDCATAAAACSICDKAYGRCMKGCF
jgi:hypothetical protein